MRATTRNLTGSVRRVVGPSLAIILTGTAILLAGCAPAAERSARGHAPGDAPETPKRLRVQSQLIADRIEISNDNRFRWRDCHVQIKDRRPIWSAQPLDTLGPGASVTYQVSDFQQETEQANASEVDGEPLILTCRTPRGLAWGESTLRP